MQALIEKAKLDSNKKNKEDYYEKALEIAQKMNSKEDIEQIQTSLFKNSPRLNPAPQYKDYSAIGMDYRFHRQFDKALDTYRKILNSKEATTEDKFQALKNIRMTYKVAQRRQDYISSTGDLVTWARSEEHTSELQSH